MSWLLAIDCTDQACSVALGQGDNVSERFTAQPRQHAQRVLPMMRELLAEAGIQKAQLDAIAVAVGPGSFTGLRIALSVSQGLSYALDKPLLRVSSLHALAMRCSTLNMPGSGEKQVFVGLDARMGEVYCAGFQVSTEGVIQRNTEDLLLSENDAVDMVKNYSYGLGSAFSLPAFSTSQFINTRAIEQIHAKDVYRIGLQEFTDGRLVKSLNLEPSYLRRETAWKKLDQQGE